MARRSFLRYAGLGATAGAVIASSCRKHSNESESASATIDIGAGDIGILNYAYALEQLEAAFYMQVALAPYAGITATESALLTDIRDHEVAHREFFKAALGTSAIAALKIDLGSIDFSSRVKVLAVAQLFEDTGVTAYNGAACKLQNADYLDVVGKIVSVEARHASYIRNLLSYGSFADGTVLDTNAMDKAQSIAQVLPVTNAYLITKVSAVSFNYTL
jgi:rubrerythrin